MTRALQRFPLCLAAAGLALAQVPAFPAGTWQSATGRLSSFCHNLVQR